MTFAKGVPLFALGLVLLSSPALVYAQVRPTSVVDQTDQPLPGATVSLLRAEVVVATSTTDTAGLVTFPQALPGDVLQVSLPGFESVSVPWTLGARLVLRLARKAEETVVTPERSAIAAPNAATLGTTVSGETVARMPSSAQMKAKESLPLLPSVIRGPDGLLHLGGAMAHDTPVVLDGFSVSDPATGLSSLNLPFEMVRDVSALRDPMTVSYGGLLGGVVAMESLPGSDTWRFGVQGVVPRPRFESPGLGRIEGVFPRVYASGSADEGRIRYATAAEFDYERFSVPGVTRGRGPDSVERALTWFGRLDRRWNPRHSTTIEGVLFPSHSGSLGLSPRRTPAATLDLAAKDSFIGVAHRIVSSTGTVVSWRFSALMHSVRATPNGSGEAISTPLGWQGNWFVTADRAASRLTTSLSWDRAQTFGGRVHELGLLGEVSSRRLRGHIEDGPVRVEDGEGRLVRQVEFGPRAAISSEDVPLAVAARDLWHVTSGLTLEGGVRVDHTRYGGATTSARTGLSLALDSSETTVLKAGYGTFTGTLPLAVPAFRTYPVRIDRSFDRSSGAATEIHMQPTVDALRAPHATAAVVSVERRIAPGLVAQIGFTDRRSSRIATLVVPSESGPLAVKSTGTGRYREAQVAAQKTWTGGQQAFASYVLSSTAGELNEFTVLLRGLDAPLLQPGGYFRQAADARHRVVAWGSVNMPKRVVISPAMEWHTGFRYSAVDTQSRYVGTPNAHAFPPFLAVDMVVYKTVTVKQRTADLGVQLFNVTKHANPRDVYPVAGEPSFGRFTNSIGRVLRGYMLVKW